MEIDGAIASYIKLPERLLHRLPENISFEEGAAIEPLSTVTHAVIERGSIGLKEFVVIIGPGPIGLLAAQLVRTLGAKKVVMVGKARHLDFKLKVAKELGLDHIIASDRVDLADFVKEKTSDLGSDAVIECSGAEESINIGINILAKRGKLLLMGFTGSEYNRVKLNLALYKEINISTTVNSTNTSWDYAISLVEEGKINLKKIISNVLPLSEFDKALELIKNKRLLK